MKKTDCLPWENLMAIALGALKLSPEAFWRMTPCEWQAGVKGWKASHGIEDAPAIARDDLRALMQKFPDATAAQNS